MANYKCNLIVPGFAKSGTSSLHNYLNCHDRICMSTPKETHHFSITKRYEKGHRNHNEIFRNQNINLEVSYYGESSTSYSIWVPAMEKIRDNLDNFKVIILLREPVERLLSHYLWLWTLGLEKRNILYAIREEEQFGFNPKFSLKGAYPCYYRASNYSYWCGMMEQTYGEDNILYVDSEKLFKNKMMALNECFEFLGLEKLIYLDEIHSNKTGNIGLQRTLGLHLLKNFLPYRLLHWINVNTFLKSTLKTILGRKRLTNKPILKEKDIEIVTTMLEKEIIYYRKKFEK